MGGYIGSVRLKATAKKDFCCLHCSFRLEQGPVLLLFEWCWELPSSGRQRGFVSDTGCGS